MLKLWEHLDEGQKIVCRAFWNYKIQKGSYLDYQYKINSDGIILGRKYLLENCLQFFRDQRVYQNEFERQMRNNRI